MDSEQSARRSLSEWDWFAALAAPRRITSKLLRAPLSELANDATPHDATRPNANFAPLPNDCAAWCNKALTHEETVMFAKKSGATVEPAAAAPPPNPLDHPAVTKAENQARALSVDIAAARKILEEKQAALQAMQRNQGKGALAAWAQGQTPSHIEDARLAVEAASRQVTALENAAREANTEVRLARQNAISERSGDVARFMRPAERRVALAVAELTAALRDRLAHDLRCYEAGYHGASRQVPHGAHQLLVCRDWVRQFFQTAIDDGVIDRSEIPVSLLEQ